MPSRNDPERRPAVPVPPPETGASTAHADVRTPTFRVAVVTEVCLYREGLVRLLGSAPDVMVVGTAATGAGADAIAAVGASRPDIVIIDAATLRSTDLAGAVMDALPDTRIVTFAVAEEDDAEVVACVESGAVGFVARNATTEELLAVIRSAARGEVRCSAKIAALVFRRVARAAALRWVRPDAAVPSPARLTAREAQVVELVDAGLSNKEIARRLCISTATVKSHVHHILEKLQFRRRAQAAAFVRASRRGRM